MPTTGEFVTYPVGQGLFYAGKLIENGEIFNFIYDCGSKTNKEHLMNCITEYQTFNGTNDIDMLVISHFDSDHVNGLQELAKKFKVKRVFFPYIKNINIRMFSYALKVLKLKRVIRKETQVILMSETEKNNHELPSLDELESQGSNSINQLELQEFDTDKDVKEKEDLVRRFKFFVFKKRSGARHHPENWELGRGDSLVSRCR
ncbi:MBL fold metallo-hydrolase [Bacillus benzoevorans]|uniref:Metal-dependent hydrolase (Beta-lactamase superfamily II) n=1 Tax=Bacillus benzoevorans TaxID=1456 RepID=A0A7X0LWM4_9BACI|nr:MBL fold metallo-hydrolase [Bacillus benzoevorans]MBB6446710.1 metal-dependent hydrolase (beta-lactamase superfamily II) [Bacillus benzoevorans]